MEQQRIEGLCHIAVYILKKEEGIQLIRDILGGPDFWDRLNWSLRTSLTAIDSDLYWDTDELMLYFENELKWRFNQKVKVPSKMVWMPEINSSKT